MLQRNSLSQVFKFSIIVLCLNLYVACSSDDDEVFDKTAEIVNYVGTWETDGLSGTGDTEKIIIINENLSYQQTVDQFQTSSKLIRESTQVTLGTITDIDTSENNSAYETIFLDIDSVEMTPRTPEEAAQWNADEFGGDTTWIAGQTKVFDEDNIGEWLHGSIWQSNIAISVRLEGTLLNVNERGGFDGLDPEEDVYF